jgi:hypothetical protein
MFLMTVPPALIGLVSATYGIRTIISINKRRNQFNELLANRLNITSSLYFRLMCFAGVDALATTPISVSFIVFLLKTVPWISWKDSHSDVNRVDQYPAIVWHNFRDASGYEFIRWIHVHLRFHLFFCLWICGRGKISLPSHYQFLSQTRWKSSRPSKRDCWFSNWSQVTHVAVRPWQASTFRQQDTSTILDNIGIS